MLELALSGLVLCALLFAIFARRGRKQEFARFRKQLLKLLSGEAPDSQLRFREKELGKIWTLLSFKLSPKAQASEGKGLEELSQIAEQLDQTPLSTLGEILFQQTQPEAKALWIYLKGRGLTYFRGLTAVSINRAVTNLCERLLEGQELECEYWENSLELDLSAQGVGQFFICPLNSRAGGLGVVILGLGSVCSQLEWDRRKAIEELCRYSAGLIAASERVSERLEKVGQQRDFILGAGHDLRAPGNTALYAVRELLNNQAYQVGSRERRHLEIISSCIEDQLEVLSDVLDIARYEDGQVKAEKERVMLPEVIGQIVSKYQSVAVAKGLEFNAGVLPGVWLELDPGHLKRIVENLLSNALKYTTTGSIELEWELSEQKVLLHVLDTGCGIPAAESKELFKKYARFSSGLAKPGLGLGLAVCKVLAEVNQLELSYAPRSAGGSVFSLSIPKIPGEENQLHKRQRQNISSRPSGTLALIVDDDELSCRAQQRILREQVERVVFAHSVKEAKLVIERERPQFILSDYYLPDGNASDIVDCANQQELKARMLVLSGFIRGIAPLQIAEQRVAVLEKPSERQVIIRALFEP